jgi:hypothetical protein
VVVGNVGDGCLNSVVEHRFVGPSSQDEGSEGQERSQYSGEARCEGEGGEGARQVSGLLGTRLISWSMVFCTCRVCEKAMHVDDIV